ncbi:MAG TPA: lipoyl(octanoyl) transferase LipB [Dehalococcoidia bacterium]|nr:lipoyl(octanoyl) transferase LipB [Dehalococcoidia bacterium]
MTPQPACRAPWLARVEYAAAWRLQQELVQRRAAGLIPDTLLLLEHPPVYTTGRRGAGDHLLLPATALGAPLIETDRGGDITFHGPGQLVAYTIVDLKAAGLGILGFVRALEQVVISTLAEYGIEGRRESGLTGVWVAGEKIAAIGVRVSRPGGAAAGWITSHGLALNVDVDLSWFERIVPCGIAGRGVTSIVKLLGQAPPLDEVAARLAGQFGRVFGRRLEWETASTAALPPR